MLEQVFKKNDAKAIEWYEKANAYKSIGKIYNDKNDFSEALKWYTKAAETGDSDDQLFLATYLYNHEMYAEALEWSEKIIDDENTNVNIKQEAQDYIKNAKSNLFFQIMLYSQRRKKQRGTQLQKNQYLIL